MFIHNLKDNNFLKESVITFGNFDGIHAGHQKIMNKLQQISKENSLPQVLITFNPHTSIVLNDVNFKILTPLKAKKSIFQSHHLDYLCLINFDIAFSKLTADDFLGLIINKYNPKFIIFGYDLKMYKLCSR